ncbi:hypothetical protein [Nocardia iowensis]|uniref:Uncharacterized protein n=1 Tax=Nocardia iowensis TaxID=204891 RepID=A0ABX8RF66_NOCIO|nr:hypothetical protein [Nocardia iowensis]QXN88243.1 hypothetical protein KV110_21810 [Nocardia iowensis]
MTLHSTEWTITSDLTPESAYRDTEDADTWRLSWLADRALTRAQARAGMELDELLSDPLRVHDQATEARVDACAEELGVLRAEAVILLAKRIAARLQQPVRHAGDQTSACRTGHAYRLRSHVIEPPYVHG